MCEKKEKKMLVSEKVEESIREKRKKVSKVSKNGKARTRDEHLSS